MFYSFYIQNITLESRPPPRRWSLFVTATAAQLPKKCSRVNLNRYRYIVQLRSVRVHHRPTTIRSCPEITDVLCFTILPRGAMVRWVKLWMVGGRREALHFIPPVKHCIWWNVWFYLIHETSWSSQNISMSNCESVTNWTVVQEIVGQTLRW